MTDLILIMSYFLIAILTHELGHVIVGLLHGWQCYYIIFGPIKINFNRKRGWTIRWVKNPTKWGGAVAIMPKTADLVEKNQVIRVVAAGPIMSIVVAMIGGWVFELSTFAWISFAIGVITALPYRRGNVYSDGGKVRQLITSNGSAEVQLAVARIGAQVFRASDFTLVDTRDLKILMDSEDPRDIYRGYYYTWCYYQDLGHKKEAIVYKDKLDELGRDLPISLRLRLQKM